MGHIKCAISGKPSVKLKMPFPYRMITESLADMESRYNRALEKTALLEEELVAKDQLREENQRLKDEIRGKRGASREHL